MKKIILLFLLLASSVFYSQTNGITYQAILYSPNEVNNGESIPLINKDICLQFTIVDELSQNEYQESINTTTDEFGMVNLVIGSGNQTGGHALSFSAIQWSLNQKSLVVALDINGQCGNFIQISNQGFSTVPFAFVATNAENVTGVVSIENGGTNAITVLDAKTNLELDNVDNTSDADKPISAATETALNLKENSANKSTDVALSDATDVKFPTEKAVKTYVDGQVITINTNNTTAIATLQADIDLNEADSDAADAALQSDINTLETTITDNATDTAAAIAAVQADVDQNEADSDAAEAALQVNINTLETTVTDNATGTAAAIAAVQSDVDQNEADSDAVDTTLQTNINTLETTVNAHAATTATALAAAQTDIDANETAANTAIALKENAANKSTDVSLSDATNVKFPTEKAVKTYVDAQVTSSTTNNTAAIAAVQADVNQNEADSDAADAALQTAINTLGTTVTANATSASTAIAAVQADVNQNEADSDVADVALQSNINTLGTTVTANAASASTAIAAVQADVDQNEADSDAADAALQANINTLGTTVTTNAASASTAITAVQADVDQNESDSDAADAALQANINSLGTTVTDNATDTATALATVQADVDQNEADSDAADAVLQTNIDALETTVTDNATDTATALAAVQADVDQNEADSDAADAVLQTNIDALETTVTDNATDTATALAAVQADVDQNESDSDAADAALQSNIDTLETTVTDNATDTATALAAVQADVDANETAANTAIALKENSANKSTDVALADGTNVKFPTEKAVKTYVDGVVTTAKSLLLPLTGGTLTGALSGTTATFSSTVTANSFVKTSGTSSQFLMADGSVSALLREADDEINAAAGQIAFTLTQTPAVTSKVKMYINGIRISKSAYSVSGTTLTYVPANNGSYSISLADRVQFEYTY